VSVTVLLSIHHTAVPWYWANSSDVVRGQGGGEKQTKRTKTPDLIELIFWLGKEIMNWLNILHVSDKG
jgi:hypothetical protein